MVLQQETAIVKLAVINGDVNMNKSNVYEDIIHLERPVDDKHPKMSIHDRAAQFSPFAALTGHGDAINETARYVDEKLDLAEDAIISITNKLNYLQDHIKEKPQAVITYFIPDERKSGGRYVTELLTLKKIDNVTRTILFDNGMSIKFDNVFEIER